MKLTVNITEVRKSVGTYGEQKSETATVVDVPDVEMTPTLAASFLRALATEIDPPKAMPNPTFVHNTGTLR